MLQTSITKVLGLLPMVSALSIDLFGQDIAVGASSTQWWTLHSSAIAGGLAFATVLTPVLTSCMLMLGENVSPRAHGRNKKSKNTAPRLRRARPELKAAA